MAAKKKSTKKVAKSTVKSLEDKTRLPGVENIGAEDTGSGSLVANTPAAPKTFALDREPYTAEDIPDLTDKVAETRLKADALRKREVRANTKLETHIRRMEQLRTGAAELDPRFKVPNIAPIRVMNEKIVLSRLITPVDEATVRETQRVADKQIRVQSKKPFGEKATSQEVADALNTKSWLKKKVVNPDTGKKEPVAPWTPESVEEARARRAMAQGERPSSSIEDRLRSVKNAAGNERVAAIREHLLAKSNLEEAQGDFESIQEQAAAAKSAGAAREAERAEAPAGEVDAATGLPYGSKNTIARGKSKTDPSVENVGGDIRKKQQVGLTDSDAADLSRAISSIRGAVEQGGGNVKFPTHTRSKSGEVKPIASAKKTPISGGGIDSLLESVRLSHSGAVTGQPNYALGHLREAHETLLTLKALVPHGTEIQTPGGSIDFHKTLDSAITAHASAHRSILGRIVKRDKTIKSTLPTLTDVKAGLGKADIKTIKGGRKVYNIDETSGEAVGGAAGRKLANIAGIGGTAESDRDRGLIPRTEVASAIEYGRNRAPEKGDRVATPETRQTEADIEAYSVKKGARPGRNRNAEFFGAGMGPNSMGLK